MTPQDRDEKLKDLQEKQDAMIRFAVEIKDSYFDEPECSLLLSNIRNAGDQILKLRQRFAVGELAPESEKTVRA